MPYIQVSNAGCWYAERRGYDGIAREIIADAALAGMPINDEDETIIETDTDDLPEGGEGLNWLAERAEAYLANLAPEGYWIGWNDGDFGMYPIDDEESEV